MPIEMTIIAADAEDMKKQLLAFAVMFAGAPVEQVTQEIITDVKTRGKTPKKFTPILSPGQVSQEATPEEPQGSGAPAPVTEPGPGTTPSSAGEQMREASTATFDDQTVVTPPKEALALKEKVIDLLQEAFRNGKVKQVRSVLGTYGNGAKSFREIDIAQFPEIDRALERGALN